MRTTSDSSHHSRPALSLAVTILMCCSALAQKPAAVKESTRTFTTYDFSDPNPIAEIGKVYPYYRFDGYTNTPAKKEWKIVELENDYIKVMVLPEIGGKIWAAWEKSTGKPFIYYNEVVKFRDVAMRGPWTSGGIEANYGIIGHTPNCATPMDYTTKTNPDGSVSCFVGTLDLLTQTYWTIEINLPRDKAYFTTRSFWNNSTPLEQPYYTWMNVGLPAGASGGSSNGAKVGLPAGASGSSSNSAKAGLPAGGHLQFIYPGNRYIGHSGEYSDWPINSENGKNISFYENNNFGGPKSYHIIGKYSDFFGAYYHGDDFGMARYSLRDEKAGRKIWIWGLSRNGMIWEDLLTDNNGQYVEVQSGRLFNQASDGSNYTPFKQLGFAPHTSDEWTEYWFPVKGTKGFVKANAYGALNLRTTRTSLLIDFSPLQNMAENLEIYDGDNVIYSKSIKLTPLKVFSDSVAFSGNIDRITVALGGTKLRYKADPKDGVLSRPVDAPEDFDWTSVFGSYTIGKEFLQQRYYSRAAEKFGETLEKDPNYLPALTELAMIAYRNFEYQAALDYTLHALRIDTYDPSANYYYGLINAKLNRIADAKDGFDIAALSPSHRGAAYTELSKIYFRGHDYDKSRHYAEKSLELNAGNVTAWQIQAVTGRIQNQRDEAERARAKLEELSPLNHFIRFEKFRMDPSNAGKASFREAIRNELPHETYLELADFYASLGRPDDAAEVLALSPPNAEVYYRLAYLKDQIKPGSGKDLIESANAQSPSLVFPFRASSAEALEWIMTKTGDWKPKYFLGLIYWSRDNTARAKQLFADCGAPDFAPFYAARAVLYDNDTYEADLRRAAQLDPRQWRYGKMLADHHIERKKYSEALAVATDYSKRFAGDFRISMLLAKAHVLNNQYKAATELLKKTTVLPYEGATDGRQLYREAWLLQAVDQLKAKRYTAALASINHAKEWPENLGAGKPYDDMLDLRLENYMEALVYEKDKQKEKANAKLIAVTNADARPGHQINDLITALAYRKTGRSTEGEKILNDWIEAQPDNETAQWAYAVYNGKARSTPPGENSNVGVISKLVGIAD